MVDLGIYNFIKNALAQGQPKETIAATLAKQGMSEADIAAAFASVEGGEPAPAVQAPPGIPLHSFPSPTLSPEATTTRHTFSAWEEFRSVFWKYFFTIFAIGIVGDIFYILHVQIISLILFIVNFILGIRLAIAVGAYAKQLDGKSHLLLAIISFFVPAAGGYYFVYKIAKNISPDISLTILEWLYVIFGFFLYIVRLVLVAIVIVGITTAIFLTGDHLVTTHNSGGTGTTVQFVSSNPSGDNAAIESDLDTILTQSTIYADENNHNYGTSTDCTSGPLFTNQYIQQFINDIKKYSSYAPICRSNGPDFVVEEQLEKVTYPSNIPNPNKNYWCIDSNGKAEALSNPISSSSYSCE